MSNDRNNTEYILPVPSVLAIPAEEAKRLIAAQSPPAALLYLYVLSRGGAFTPEDAHFATGLEFGEIEHAVRRLTELKLIAVNQSVKISRADTIPEYDAEEITKAACEDPGFAKVVEAVQHILGKQLSGRELMILFGIGDFYGLANETIILLAHYWAKRERARRGANCKMIIYDLEKEAHNWSQRGILTPEAADDYITELLARDDSYEAAKAALGVFRKLTPLQEGYLNSWLQMGFKPDALAVAYDRTLTQTGQFAWKYADAVLRNWHGKNLYTREEIERGDPLNRKQSNNGQKRVSNGMSVAPYEPDDNMLRDWENLLKK
ncbi:MAG: DnaD domain protein [Oscillospiraceae bacterium]|nr:DnaD domain protein [Oscillospiraceae bacterium]